MIFAKIHSIFYEIWKNWTKINALFEQMGAVQIDPKDSRSKVVIQFVQSKQVYEHV